MGYLAEWVNASGVSQSMLLPLLGWLIGWLAVVTLFEFLWPERPDRPNRWLHLYVLIYDVLIGTLGAYYHSNILVSEKFDSLLRKVFVSQRWHLSHHSSDITYTNMNYAILLTAWDNLFGTARLAPDPAKITFGITQLDGPAWQTFAGLWATPFRNPKRK